MKSMMENRGRWDAGFRSPPLRFFILHFSRSGPKEDIQTQMGASKGSGRSCLATCAVVLWLKMEKLMIPPGTLLFMVTCNSKEFTHLIADYLYLA